MARKATTKTPTTKTDIGLTDNAGDERPAMLDQIAAAPIEQSAPSDSEGVLMLDENGNPERPDHGEPPAHDENQYTTAAQREAFYSVVFSKVFQFVPIVAGAEYQAIDIQTHEREGARQASDALCNVLSHYLPDMLDVDGIHGQTLIAAQFIGAKMFVAWMIYKSTKARPAERTQSEKNDAQESTFDLMEPGT
jgi:hypothetical protein